MPESLPVQNYSRWQALVAHPLWEGFMVRTVIVDLVSELLERHAILALLIGLMLPLALLLDLNKVMLKAFVL